MREAPILGFLFMCALISVVTTVGIVLVLLEEALQFFREVSVVEFLTGTEWTPLFSNKKFGVLPLLSATALISFMALGIAFPVGLLTAIYLSEYAPESVRSTVKPVLEVLAGIPTVVFGFFAISFINPSIIRPLFDTETIFTALGASMAMGVMLIPMVASLSEDAMRAVPSSLREGAYAVGSDKFQVAVKVVVPAALSGIVAAALLALARAVGETMIVTIAAGGVSNLSWNPLEAMQTMTAYIMEVATGDTPRGTVEYESIFAVGLMLFLFTLSSKPSGPGGTGEVQGDIRMIPNIAFERGRPTRRSQSVRKGRGVAFVALAMSASFLGVVVLAVLLITVVRDGIGVLSLDFINSFPHYKPEEAGAKSALAGTLWVMMFTALFAIITGVGAAIYLEEFARRNWLDSDHRDQHQQPGGSAVRRVRAAGACGVRVRDGPGSQHPGGRAHPGPADTADYHRCVSGRAEVGAALHAGGGDGAGVNPLAGRLAPGAAGGYANHTYRIHTLAGQGHRRDCTAHRGGSVYNRALRPQLPHRLLHGAARADIQLDRQTSAGISGERRRGYHRAAGGAPVDERSCHNPAQHIL